MDVIDVAICGVGGSGSALLRAADRLQRTDWRVRLSAVYDPAIDQYEELLDELYRPVRRLRDFNELLHDPAQLIWMPSPDPRQRSVLHEVLSRGKWLLCDHPAIATLQELDALIATRDAGQSKVAIAFADLHEAATARMKSELISGRIGQITRCTVYCCRARTSAYYGRSPWAGRLRLEGTWVLESPILSDMADSIVLPLFLLGKTMERSTGLVSVEAELYRSRPIQSADTCCIRAMTVGGVEMLIYLSGACPGVADPEIVIEGDAGALRISTDYAKLGGRYGGALIARTPEIGRSLQAAVAKWSGNEPERPLASLENIRSHLLMVNAAFDASDIHDIAHEHLDIGRQGESTHPIIRGLEDTFHRCAAGGMMISEGSTAWAKPSGKIELAGYRDFAGTRIPKTAL